MHLDLLVDSQMCRLFYDGQHVSCAGSIPLPLLKVRDEQGTFTPGDGLNYMLAVVRKYDPNPMRDPKTGQFMSKPGTSGSRFLVDGSLAPGKAPSKAKAPRDPHKDFRAHVRAAGKVPYKVDELQLDAATRRAQRVLSGDDRTTIPAAPVAIPTKPVDVASQTIPDPKPNATPRQNAEAATKAMDAEYEFARASEIRNAGEDLKGSARHKVNAWRGLEQAEKDGTAVAMVTRDNLLKAEPHDLLSAADKNPLAALAMHFALRSFPAKPGYGNERRRARQSEETKQKDRRQYVETYRALRDAAERIAESSSDPESAIQKLRNHVSFAIDNLRDIPVANRNSYAAVYSAKDPTNSTANALIGMLKQLEVGRRASKTGVAASLAKFKAASAAKYGESTPDHQTMAEHAKDVIEGTSIPASFGQKTAKKSFDPNQFYVREAHRVGGRDVAEITSNASDATTKLVSAFGARGVQWGNSVTDSERQHHAARMVEAMADLADVTGMKPKDLSLDGTLGYAIGARGHGRAMAHYEPGTKVINMTRMSGVGCLAHEWGHAFDHSLTDFKTTPKSAVYLSENGRLSAEQGTVPRAMEDVRKSWSESGYARRLAGVLRDKIIARTMSEDSAKYWASTREIFARTFERYVQHKLRSEGRDNTYLSGLGGDGMSEKGLWPTNEEIAKMAPAMDALLAAHRKQKYGTTEHQAYSNADLKKFFVENVTNRGESMSTSLTLTINSEPLVMTLGDNGVVADREIPACIAKISDASGTYTPADGEEYMFALVRKYDPNPLHDPKNGHFMTKPGGKRSRYKVDGSDSGRGSKVKSYTQRNPHKDFRYLVRRSNFGRVPYEVHPEEKTRAEIRAKRVLSGEDKTRLSERDPVEIPIPANTVPVAGGGKKGKGEREVRLHGRSAEESAAANRFMQKPAGDQEKQPTLQTAARVGKKPVSQDAKEKQPTKGAMKPGAKPPSKGSLAASAAAGRKAAGGKRQPLGMPRPGQNLPPAKPKAAPKAKPTPDMVAEHKQKAAITESLKQKVHGSELGQKHANKKSFRWGIENAQFTHDEAGLDHLKGIGDDHAAAARKAAKAGRLKDAAALAGSALAHHALHDELKLHLRSELESFLKHEK